VPRRRIVTVAIMQTAHENAAFQLGTKSKTPEVIRLRGLNPRKAALPDASKGFRVHAINSRSPLQVLWLSQKDNRGSTAEYFTSTINAA
jgi:hypothetical protein